MAKKHLLIHTGMVTNHLPIHLAVLYTLNCKCQTSTSRSSDPFTRSLWMAGQSEPCGAVVGGVSHIEVCYPHPPSRATTTVSLHVTVHLHCSSIRAVHPVVAWACKWMLGSNILAGGSRIIRCNHGTVDSTTGSADLVVTRWAVCVQLCYLMAWSWEVLDGDGCSITRL